MPEPESALHHSLPPLPSLPRESHLFLHHPLWLTVNWLFPRAHLGRLLPLPPGCPVLALAISHPDPHTRPLAVVLPAAGFKSHLPQLVFDPRH